MKNEIIQHLEVIKTINEKYELITLEGKSSKLLKEMDNFVLKLLFVGGFSAGKSALINALIGRYILKEGQRPETAIAGELIYDQNEYIEAISGDSTTSYGMNENEIIDTTKYDYLIFHLNSEELKKIGGCVIVDMPGFNSGIQNHNKAILRYAGSGNAYILVIDSEEGAIKQSISEFINEIRQYDDNLAITVTKSDLKVKEDIEEICEDITLTASEMFGREIQVISTSKHDPQVSDKLVKLINSFDREQIFDHEFAPQVRDICLHSLDSLETYKKSISLDLSDYDNEIEKHKRAGAELSAQLEREKKKLDNEFSFNVTQSVMNDVESALYSHADSLANSLRSGEKAFTAAVNNILRPVLVNSTKQYAQSSFDKFISGIDMSISDNVSSMENFGEDAVASLKKTSSRLVNMIDNLDEANTVYKTVTTTLAVITSTIAPWLELIIIFLPEILKLINKPNANNTLKQKVTGEIIPQILSNLRPEMEKSLSELKEKMADDIENNINEMINNEIEAIEIARSRKQELSNKMSEQIADVDADIKSLTVILEKLS